MRGRVVAAIVGAVLTGAVAAAPAQAQINYYTQGWFTSSTSTCNNVVPSAGSPTSNTCVTPAWTLTYAAKAPNGNLILSGSVVSLGTFALTVTGSATVSPGAAMFTLAIQQLDPVTGTGTLVGSLSGAVMMNDDFSSMMWIPSADFVEIGDVRYTLIFNDRGPAANQGIAFAVNNERTPTSLNAVVTTNPEPASLVLLGTGLLGLAAVTRRKRGTTIGE